LIEPVKLFEIFVEGEKEKDELVIAYHFFSFSSYHNGNDCDKYQNSRV